MRAVRLSTDGPISRPRMDGNINGLSLLRAPEWLPNRLGAFYLYFADHKGDYIRLAYADHLLGPWRTRESGTLRLDQTSFPRMLDEFDAKLNDALAQGWGSIRISLRLMSSSITLRSGFACTSTYSSATGRRLRSVAVSADGLNFDARDEVLTTSYLRVIHLDEVPQPGWYGMLMPGLLYRSNDGPSGFECGPQLFTDTRRHCDMLCVFWTNVGDAPERIYVSSIAMQGDWRAWTAGDRHELLRPVFEWKGADLPITTSVCGFAPRPVHELRDPAIFEDGESVYLLYTVQGERGIAIAQLDDC